MSHKYTEVFILQPQWELKALDIQPRCLKIPFPIHKSGMLQMDPRLSEVIMFHLRWVRWIRIFPACLADSFSGMPICFC